MPRRLVPLRENLKAWLAPWREESGPIVTMADPSGAMGDTAVKARIPGGWRQNALRHSFISTRTIDNWVAKQIIPFIRVGPRFYLYDFEAVLAAIRKHYEVEPTARS